METSGLIVVVQLVWAWIGLFRAVRTRVQVSEQLLEEQEKEEDEQEPAGQRTAGTIFLPFALQTRGGHGASTKAVYYLFNKHLRDSGVPGEALKRKLNKDISFALRRGTIATLLPARTSPPSAPPRQPAF